MLGEKHSHALQKIALKCLIEMFIMFPVNKKTVLGVERSTGDY
jgi:hypothetical protein